MTYSSYLNYGTFVSTIANLLVVPTTDPNFQQILPAMIADGEQRCYRELDLLDTQVRDTAGTLTANSRTFTLPQTYGMFIVTNNMNVFTPSGTQTNRNQLIPTTRDWMDAVYGNEASSTTPSVPRYYAPITDQIFIVGPSPDAGYTMEVLGTIRPTPLSASQTTTYLTTVLPDLFIAACMIFGSSYQLNFSQVADDPQQAVSWETHFNKLLASANTEENRKKYASQAWTSQSPAPLATPPRM
jgi:hypothetical protein